MDSLENIIRKNSKAALKSAQRTAETETTRHCSYSGDPQKGIVLHSAKLRSTAFIRGLTAKQFLASWLGTNSADKRDALVESYFGTPLERYRGQFQDEV